MVYVDDMEAGLGRMVMCHMLPRSKNVEDIDELHKMAKVIGVARRWFQDKRVPHYDVCKSKRVLAVKAGAVEIEYGGKVFKEILRRMRA